jgi:PTS system beta-glucosides-specific IIC component
MTGMHLVLIYAGYDLFFAQGYDSFILPCMAIAFMAASGLALGAFLKFKNKKEKAVAGGYLASAVIGGVTEPTLYGIGLRYKRPLFCMAVGGFVGGAYAGITGVQYLITGAPAFLMPLTFVGGTTANMINGTIAIFLAFIVSAVLTFFFGFDKNEPALQKEGSKAALEDAKKITAPIEGTYIPQSEIPDDMFSLGMMGQAIGVIPTKGEVIAPANGTITAIAATKHAVGITTDDGAELLIHVGMDTVALNGEGFKVRVEEGEKVLRGQLLIKFNLDMLKERGIETTSAIAVTNADDMQKIDLITGRAMKAGEVLGQIEA